MSIYSSPKHHILTLKLICFIYQSCKMNYIIFKENNKLLTYIKSLFIVSPKIQTALKSSAINCGMLEEFH